MNKVLTLWFTEQDEQAFSATLAQKFERLTFLDDHVWDAEPVERPSLHLCRSRFAFLWNRDCCEELPVFERPDGRVEGPASGVVVQFIRSRREGAILSSGRLAIGFEREDKALADFVNETWRVARELSRPVNAVQPVTREVITPRVRGFRVGLASAAELERGELRRLKYNSTENYYLPVG